MHRKYGKFVRTGKAFMQFYPIDILRNPGPNEISIFHPGAFEILADAKNTARRDEFYDVLRPRFSVVFTRDKGEHKALRALWAQGFSSKSAMDEYMPRLISLSQGLRDCIDSFGEQPINVTDVMTWFSFDVMGEVILGRDFGMMESHAENPIMTQQRRGLALLGPIIDVQWIVHLAFNFFPFVRQVQDFIKMCLFCEHEVSERMTRGTNGKPDLASRFIEEYEASKGIETETKRLQLLNGNIISAIVAGSDTNRGAMTAIWWYLSKYPNEAIKIQKELADIEAHDAKRLAKLPHLNGAINEVLRLAPPAMTGNNRISGPEGLWVDDVLIPAEVKVTTPRYVIQRLECAFVHAADFIPERWYSRPELILDKRAFAPFSLGAHQCVGKNLAMAELRLSIAVLLQQYDVAFAPDYDPDTMWRDMKDQVTAQPGRVLCTFKSRNTN
ncbi:hypothetical protein E8E13_000561 [Curvularia kusanoi]|uniref:Cytochrome P450 n=1 Tax=Curvularia kusanoi TaxID=90978 RepID=A0A9P4T6D5_CURKU|nr:hypothetical protein E8E13_000561 [Curvularia kusanoi]